MNMIYLASPYTDDDKGVEHARFEAVCEYAAAMMLSGLHVFSPIAHGHSLAAYGPLPTDFEFWEDYCNSSIARCDVLAVLRLPGWGDSRGVSQEMKWAKTLKMPIRMLNPDLLPSSEFFR